MTYILARKIGMTQIFQESGKLVPVTALNVNQWIILRYKTIQKDGYSAVVVGLLRKKYWDKSFELSWLKKLSTYFSQVKELKITTDAVQLSPGSKADFTTNLSVGELFDACGTTKGYGFQGVVKRHSFTGGLASHGSCLGRKPGSIGNHRSQGKVAKGRKLPGHMGCDKRTIQKLQIIKIEQTEGIIFIKGSLPGFAGSTVCLKRNMSNV